MTDPLEGWGGGHGPFYTHTHTHTHKFQSLLKIFILGPPPQKSLQINP